MTHTASLVDDASDGMTETLEPCLPEAVAPSAPSDTSNPVEEYQIPPALLELLGPLGTTIADCFRRMSLAESAIQRFCARHPGHAKRLDGAFCILNWQLPVRVREQIYVAHLEELLQRVVDGQCVSEGTRAEALVFLNTASVRAPLRQQAAALYAELFRELLHTEALFEEDKNPTEPWRGASAELLETLRRDLRVADRIYPKTGDAE